MLENNELKLAEEFILYTNQNIFLTGKAGTGKTTFLKTLANKSAKRMIVTAPTGVAAINARGVTLHSFFQLPFGPIITERVAGRRIENQMFKHKYSKEKINIIKTLDLLIIDEISMVRADILDAIDEVLRRFKNRFLPFGGLQLLMIGDLQQLPPVVKNEEYSLLKTYYDSFFFFGSKALSEANMITIELKHIYRQKDSSFIKLLNEIRDNTLSKDSFNLLHERYIPGFKPENEDGYITLTTHNNSAKAINESRLKQINTKLFQFRAKTEGSFSEYAYPAEYELELKIGAQVMFIRNDSSHEKRYFNGKIGIITDIEDDLIMVKCEEDTNEIMTSLEKWENIKYTLDTETNEIGEEVIGTFIQYPLRLAWAITIHKSQGLTFEKAVIDAAAAFAHGQTYVALSRCKTLEGLVLSSEIKENAIICDAEVGKFNQSLEDNQPDKHVLDKAKFAYQSELIHELFNYKQLTYRLDKFVKVLGENSSAYTGTLFQNVNTIIKSNLPEITGIANSFLKQCVTLSIENPDIENNKILLQRIKKAGEYFLEFHRNKILKPIEESSFESDNREIKKVVREGLSGINELLNMKQMCLMVCIDGFKVENFLNARARSVLVQKEKPANAKPIERVTETKYPDLYAELKEWRKRKADSEDIELYMVLPNKALQKIADELPAAPNRLKLIPGIGKKKFELYGEEIIEILKDFIKNKHLQSVEDIPEIVKKRKKGNKEISLELYKAGKSIREIAEIQGFVISTIENHLGAYIESGEIKIEELLDPIAIKEIMNFFKSRPGALLSEAKHALPETYSWSQIRYVQSYIQLLKK